jgi:hypothetical protein
LAVGHCRGYRTGPPLAGWRCISSPSSGCGTAEAHSPLSCGPDLAGSAPGTRLPNYLADCNGRRIRLHDLTAKALDSAAPSSWLHVHRLDSWPGTGVAIVRPDGYLGFSAASVDSSEVAAWLARVAVRLIKGSDVLQLGRAGWTVDPV